jgi:hypothetical protein
MIRGTRHTKVLLGARLFGYGPAHSEVGSSSHVSLSNVHGGEAGIVTVAVTAFQRGAPTTAGNPSRTVSSAIDHVSRVLLRAAVELMQVLVDYERSIGHLDAEADAARVEELCRQLHAGEVRPHPMQQMGLDRTRSPRPSPHTARA